jgi:sulfur carrier protein
MIIQLNGETTSVADGCTVADVIALRATDTRGIAVAIDREVVPRGEWLITVLREGSLVEVVAAAAGG